MVLPNPEPGLVISYAYLWRREHDGGQGEGRKHRPCVIVLSRVKIDNGTQVTVTPITHSQPSSDTQCLEIPLKVKQHLGLDNERSWIILDEVNQFIWPGYDLHPISGNSNEMAYGFLPPRLFDQIRNVLNTMNSQRVKITRSD